MDAGQLNRILSGVRRTPDGFWERCAEIIGCAISEIEPERELAA